MGLRIKDLKKALHGVNFIKKLIVEEEGQGEVWIIEMERRGDILNRMEFVKGKVSFTSHGVGHLNLELILTVLCKPSTRVIDSCWTLMIPPPPRESIRNSGLPKHPP